MNTETQQVDIDQERYSFAAKVNELIWQANFDEVIYRDEYLAIRKVLGEIDSEFVNG